MSLQFTVSQDDAGKRLDHFLQENLPQYSRARLQDWIKAGNVTVDGRTVKPSVSLHGTESIAVDPAGLEPLKAFAENIPIEILYADDDLIAVNKPAGIVVHAGAGNHSGTLVNALLHHFQSLSNIGGDERPGIVHRQIPMRGVRARNQQDAAGIAVQAMDDAGPYVAADVR